MPNQLPLPARALFRIHVFCYQCTGGLVGHRLGRVRFLLLTTDGKRTGRRRTSPLLYHRDGDDIIVVASNNGLPRNPSWYLNLVANPTVDAQVGRRHMTLRACTATGAERPRLWKLMVSEFGGYEDYQRKTTREIPVVVLRPLRE